MRSSSVLAQLRGSLFEEPQEPRTAVDVLFWWEKRRIPYNLFVFVTGIVGLVFFFIAILASNSLVNGEDAVEPMALVLVPIVVNICYTFGAAIELFLRLFGFRRAQTGPLLLKIGFVFSFCVLFLPGTIWFLADLFGPLHHK